MKDKNKIWLTNNEDGVRKYRTRLGTIVAKIPKDEGVHLTMTNKEGVVTHDEVSFITRTLMPTKEPAYLTYEPDGKKVCAYIS